VRYREPQATLQAGPHAAPTIHAVITGMDTTAALGVSADGVIALCKTLVATGHHPSTRLDAYRRDMLCLRVRSIREAAGLRVGGRGVGFERDRGCAAAPPIRKSGRAGRRAAP